QRRLVIEIALDDIDTVARERHRPIAARLARQAAQLARAALQRLRDRAALMACHSGDENRSIARHACNLSLRNAPIASSASADALSFPMLATNPCGMPIHTSSRASTPSAVARSTYRRESSSSTSSSDRKSV